MAVATLDYSQQKGLDVAAILDFMEFVRQAWPVLEPSRPFVPGKHLEALAAHLEAVYKGEIRRLLVNMPPRHAKSNFINVLWPVWCWLNDPSIKFLCGSYALNLATRDNLRHRRIIKSSWFQSRYGRMFKLMRDQDAKMKFENDRSGYRMVVSVGSSTTGEGGDILILDDPHNIDEKESPKQRETAIDWFDNTWSSRLNDQQTGQMIVVAHRIHMQDVSGHILETAGDEWVHLNLAAEYDSAHVCRTVWPGGSWQDWRAEEGQLLWEERFPRPVIERAKRRHGALGYSSLYQQSPIPPGGYVFNRAYERLFEMSPEGDMFILITPDGRKVVPVAQCWELSTSDVAAKDKEHNDYTVFEHWAVTPDADVLLLDLQRGHWSIPKQKQMARQFYHAHYSQRYRAFYFESVGYQSAIAQDLLIEGIPCLEFIPRGDKTQRAIGASIWQEAGKVYFPKGTLPWMPDFQREIYNFPKDEHDDQVDPMSMVCMIVREPSIQEVDDDTAAIITSFRGY